jgi:hypothetical protein
MLQQYLQESSRNKTTTIMNNDPEKYKRLVKLWWKNEDFPKHNNGKQYIALPKLTVALGKKIDRLTGANVKNNIGLIFMKSVEDALETVKINHLDLLAFYSQCQAGSISIRFTPKNCLSFNVRKLIEKLSTQYKINSFRTIQAKGGATIEQLVIDFDEEEAFTVDGLIDGSSKFLDDGENQVEYEAIKIDNIAELSSRWALNKSFFMSDNSYDLLDQIQSKESFLKAIKKQFPENPEL